jgi:hypothetical protein
MTLLSFTKLIKEGYEHTRTLVHVKKVCDVEEHFGVMTLEYNPMNGSTVTVEKTAPKTNEVLNNQAPKKKEVLNDQAPMEKEEEKTPSIYH